MKKNILYIATACMVLGLTACSTDPDDAVEKHVYTENEAPFCELMQVLILVLLLNFARDMSVQRQLI